MSTATTASNNRFRDRISSNTARLAGMQGSPRTSVNGSSWP